MRATGPTAAVRQAVHERDGDRCINCAGTDGLQIHHRRPRAMGGTHRPDTNGQGNLILLCARCHSYVESFRERARNRGVLVSQHATPVEVPLVWHGVWVFLTDDGKVHQVAGRPSIVEAEPTLTSGSASTPTYGELRARNLLAQSLLNHRSTPEGLSAADVAIVLGALAGQLEGVGA